MIDLLFLAHERREFTMASRAALVENTNWGLVSRVVVYDDASKDDFAFLAKWPVENVCRSGRHGGPVAIMNDHLGREGRAEIFAKIDNDVIVPPGWLDQCVQVMERCPHLGLLGIEPPMSRTLAPWPGARPIPAPENNWPADRAPDFAPCGMIGGIGLMRRSVFAGAVAMVPHGGNGVGGFSDWQLQHPEVQKGWITPPLKLFLLDRLPVEPWATLSKQYIAEGVQRPWTNYSVESSELWNWWSGARI